MLGQYIDKHLVNQFIWSFKSSTRAPILFVQKSSGSLHLCVDYWGLNNITIKNQYPLLLINKLLNWLSKTKRFTQLNLTLAYHCLCIKKDNKWKTAFCTHYGHFKYQVLPFGLLNASATFQAYINKALAEKLNVFYVVYLDNILIYLEKVENHKDNIKWIFQKLREANFFVNVQKCKFNTDEVQFLGYVVLAKGIQMETSHIEAIKSWLEPSNIRNIQIFIGFANFYQCFMQGFSKKTAASISLITNLFKKCPKKPFISKSTNFLTEEAWKSFNLIKNAFIEAFIL